IYPPFSGEPADEIHPVMRDELNRNTGLPRFTMTIAAGRLYARMGIPGTVGANLPGHMGNSRLVCLDLDHGEGKPLWEKFAFQIDHDGGKWSFEGSPVVARGDVYVGLRRQLPQAQSNVACFDADSGKLRWIRKICVATGSPAELHRDTSHQLL